MRNFRTKALLAALVALFAGLGFMIFDVWGLLLVSGVALSATLWAYLAGAESVIAAYEARRVTAAEEPDLVTMVEQLADGASLPHPAVYVCDEEQPNAMAVGRNPDNAAIIVCQGLLDRLKPNEIAAVISHEFAHIRARDTLTVTLATTLAIGIGCIGALFAMIGCLLHRHGGKTAILALGAVTGVSGLIMHCALSRDREYAADEAGAAICGHPEWLASALTKIGKHAKTEPNYGAMANPITAGM